MAKDRINASNKFPRNECTSSCLKDTKHHLRVSLKSTVNHYRCMSITRWNQKEMENFNMTAAMPDTNTDYKDDNETSDTDVDDVNSYRSSIFDGSSSSSSSSESPPPSPTVRSVLKTTVRDETRIRKIRNRIKDLIEECMETKEIDEELLNCVINAVIVDRRFPKFKLESKNGLKPNMVSEINSMIYEIFIEKYIPFKIGTLHDEMMDPFTVVSDNLFSGTLNDPKWFDRFKQIFKYSPDEYEFYNKDVIKKYYVDSLYSTYDSDDSVSQEISEYCFYLNWEAFTYRFSRLDPAPLMVSELEESDYDDDSVLRTINKTDFGTPVPRKTKQLVRFIDEPVVLSFNKQDPPIYL